MKLRFLPFLLLLCVGLAQSAENTDPIYQWTWTTEGADPNNTETGANSSEDLNKWQNNFIYPVEGVQQDYAQFNNQSGNKPFNSHFDSSVWTGSFTVSFDLKGYTESSPGTYQNIFAMYNQNTVNGVEHSIRLGFQTDSTLKAAVKAFSSSSEDKWISTGLTAADLQSQTWQHFVFIGDAEQHTITLFVNGTAIELSNEWNNNQSLTGAQFGSPFGSNYGMQGTIDVNNIRFFNYANYAVVPEPTCWALTALCLTGLGMRRRR